MGDEPSNFHYKEIFVYFRTTAAKSRLYPARSCVNCPSHGTDLPSNLPENAPINMDFVQYEGSKGVLQVLNSPIFI